MNFINLKGTLKLRWESKLISSIPVSLSFYKPKKDLCKTCIVFENATVEHETFFDEKYLTHPVNKTIACDIKAIERLLSKNKPQSIACLTFDLQKVPNVPSGENSLFYYTCKLAVYNLTITDLVNKYGFC